MDLNKNNYIVYFVDFFPLLLNKYFAYIYKYHLLYLNNNIFRYIINSVITL